MPSSALETLSPLLKTLSPSIVLTPEKDEYRKHSATFSAHKEKHPAVVLAPSTVDEVATIVEFLYKTGLDFNVRGWGFKGATATDVLISMIRFDNFEYDVEKKVAQVGVGLRWIDVVERMVEVDPEYSVVVARTPAIGVAGTITTAGLSWMSTEYGCCADPINFLDAEVVKYDGSVVLASSEPELLWALRGGGGGFGVITKLYLRAHYYPTHVWSGMILVPRSQSESLLADVEAFLDTKPHPKVNMFVYFCPERLLHTILEPGQPVPKDDVVIIHAYDAFGEAHGRKTFEWALKREGVIDQTKVVDAVELMKMQRKAYALDNADHNRGKFKTLYAPMGVASLTKEEMLKAVQWKENLGATDKEIQQLSVVIFEFSVTRSPLGASSEIAWPRPVDMNHLLLIIVNAPANGSEGQEKLISKLLLEAPEIILGEKAELAMVNPAGLEPYHDTKKSYGQHYDKLMDLRKKYDPARRFKGLVNP
ncbi:FAD-binding domain-containing protein [Corynespora cassiicola Philippines]|uniref:FAD-binding domain-containing protein n=1 Tax=Corynespora cassiicola Philippines TaxID=1448308 RepID=A0A2T2N343_CORCC|nr:FAD-binding domain-containing protein [Corynespora cassiicola Philippines]